MRGLKRVGGRHLDVRRDAGAFPVAAADGALDTAVRDVDAEPVVHGIGSTRIRGARRDLADNLRPMTFLQQKGESLAAGARLRRGQDRDRPLTVALGRPRGVERVPVGWFGRTWQMTGTIVVP